MAPSREGGRGEGGGGEGVGGTGRRGAQVVTEDGGRSVGPIAGIYLRRQEVICNKTFCKVVHGDGAKTSIMNNS